MITNNSFKYSDGGEFTFNTVNNINELIVNNYIGYYHYYDGKIISERANSFESIELSARDNASAQFIKTDFNFNRVIDEVINLPYRSSDVFYQPNEAINQNTINLKLDMLHRNFLRLYNYCFVPNNDFASNYTAFIGVTGVSNSGVVTAANIGAGGEDPLRQSLNYVKADSNTRADNVNLITGLSTNFGTISGCASEDLSAANGFEVMAMKTTERNPLLKKTPEDVLLTFFSPSALNIFAFENSGNQSTVSFVLSTERAGGEFSQNFQSITDITSNNYDVLYVADSYHNQVYRLYIDPILNVSKIDASNYDLLNSGGLKLNTIGNTFLSGGVNIYYDTNEVYIYNDGAGNIAVVDENLLFSRKYTNVLLSGGNVADFAINPIDNRVYCLLNDMTIITIDKKFTGDTTRIYPVNKLLDGESCRRIVFSLNDSNVFYIATTKNIYKYYVETPGKGFLGSYDWDNTYNVSFSGTDQDIEDIKILSENETFDSLFIYDKNNTNNGKSRILRFNDSNSLIPLINNTKFKVFDFNNIKVGSEYFNNITFNKSYKKLLFNMDNLSENLFATFKFRYDDQQVLRYTTSVTLSSPFVFPVSYNNFIGVNEVMTPQVFNRVAGYLLRYQEAMLEELKAIAENEKFPPSQIIQF